MRVAVFRDPSGQGSILPPVLPIPPSMRRAVFTACLIAALVVPAGAEASQLIARNAKDITLRVNARGQALVGYRAKGKQ